jgi:uncharacterized membrane protein
MSLLLALAAAFLTSFLPILNKRLLADTPIPVVAFGINALSLPLLGFATLALFPIPTVDLIFGLGILGSGILNLAATLLSTRALKLGDASLVTPILTFNPAFTLIVAAFTLREVPSAAGTLGVLLILVGGYVLNVEGIRDTWWQPLAVIVARPALLLAIAASFLWGLTPILEKLAIQHSSPPDPPLVAFGSTGLMVLFLLPPLLPRSRGLLGPIAAHRRIFLLAALIAGIAPVFGFSAIALGLLGYVTAIFKLSAGFSVVWAYLFLRERNVTSRFLGSLLMALGAIAISA